MGPFKGFDNLTLALCGYADAVVPDGQIHRGRAIGAHLDADEIPAIENSVPHEIAHDLADSERIS